MYPLSLAIVKAEGNDNWPVVIKIKSRRKKCFITSFFYIPCVSHFNWSWKKMSSTICPSYFSWWMGRGQVYCTSIQPWLIFEIKRFNSELTLAFWIVTAAAFQQCFDRLCHFQCCKFHLKLIIGSTLEPWKPFFSFTFRFVNGPPMNSIHFQRGFLFFLMWTQPALCK